MTRRPSTALAAHRRRLLIWSPLGLAGAAGSVISMPAALTGPNGAWLAGTALAFVGCIGVVMDNGRGTD